MKAHLIVHLVWILIMLFFGVVSVDQTGVFLAYLLFGLVIHIVVWCCSHVRS